MDTNTNQINKKSRIEYKEPDLQIVLDRLVKKALDPNGDMMLYVKDYLSFYSASSIPLGTEDAKQLLFSVINMMINYRNQIPGIVVESLKNGEMMKLMKEKMIEIDELEVQASYSMQEMEIAKKSYDDLNQVYKQVLGETYVIPFDASEKSSEEPKKNWMERMRDSVNAIFDHLKNKQS